MKAKTVTKRGSHCTKCRRRLQVGERYKSDRGRLLAECCWPRVSVGRR